MFRVKTNSVYFLQAGRYVMVITQENAIIYWDGVEDVMIKLPDSYKTKPGSNHKIFGLCGTFDGNKDNDFVGIDEVKIDNTKDFAKKWLSEPSCVETSLDMPAYYSPTGSNEKAIQKAEELCSVIQKDIFAPCFPHIDVVGYKKLCMKDVLLCNYNLRSDCVCNSISLYARACQQQANITLNWRSSTLCRKLLFINVCLYYHISLPNDGTFPKRRPTKYQRA